MIMTFSFNTYNGVIRCVNSMSSKFKELISPILGLIGSIMYLLAGILYIFLGGYIGSFTGIIPVFFIIIGVFGVIGAVVGFAGRKKARRYIMFFVGIIAFLMTAFPPGFGALAEFSIVLLIVCFISAILIILAVFID